MAATLGLLLRPLCFSITRFHNKFPILQNPILFSSSSLTLPRIHSLSITYSSNSSHNDSYPLSLLDKELNEDQDLVVAENTEVKNVKLLNLTVKEKKELASYAHGLGKKLKCQLVGKSGVTDNVIFSFLETLEANELLKIKIHRTCPGELEDVVSQLEQATGSVVVGQIGRTVIIYKPSLTKMKAEEKKKEFQRAFIRRQSKLKRTLIAFLLNPCNSPCEICRTKDLYLDSLDAVEGEPAGFHQVNRIRGKVWLLDKYDACNEC
ncbi:hypothetical protein GOBAR_AA03091 [Gossypium barbadense]|uniref:CRM domain-containing protein n=1 Tax=Gossypium barbadense TaxID=3634 RepID=A0A2P5YPK2_GOSBA|nr:hypothetical protein GOBAR_AA03091 [Gossypium barbadense]